MLITRDFVMLNFPKTGSTFAREAVRRLYGTATSPFSRGLTRLGMEPRRAVELMIRRIDGPRYRGVRDQHGTRRQIPRGHRGKPVFSVTRSPFTRYVSDYRFGWWKKVPPASREELGARYPSFPELSFVDYYDMVRTYTTRERLGGIVPGVALGYHSVMFVQFYSEEPEDVLAGITSDPRSFESFRAELGSITFGRQESLREDLKSFLGGFGHAASQLAFLDTLPRVNVGDGVDDVDRFYEGNDLVERILEDDRLIFEVFPDYVPRGLGG